jgi:hypothetical protein
VASRRKPYSRRPCGPKKDAAVVKPAVEKVPTPPDWSSSTDIPGAEARKRLQEQADRLAQDECIQRELLAAEQLTERARKKDDRAKHLRATQERLRRLDTDITVAELQEAIMGVAPVGSTRPSDATDLSSIEAYFEAADNLSSENIVRLGRLVLLAIESRKRPADEEHPASPPNKKHNSSGNGKNGDGAGKAV